MEKDSKNSNDSPAEAARRAEKILLVEDDADARGYVCLSLESYGYEVSEAADGRDALVALERNKPDLIVTDVMMPFLDGFELLKAVRDDERFREIPVILLSALASEKSKIEGLEAGADDYLVKPFPTNELLARVQANLKTARIRGEAATREHELRLTAERAAEKWREAEERLRLLIESAVDYAVFGISGDGAITFWNAGAERIFGYSEAEIVGQSGEILFTPEDREKGVPETEMETALRAGRAEDERFHIRKNGSRFFGAGVMRTLKDSKVHGFVKIVRDITESKQNELRLSQQSETDAYRIRLNDTLRPLSDAAAIQGTTAQLLREYFDVGWSYYVEFDNTNTMITVASDSTRDGLYSMVGQHDFSDMPEFLRLWQAGEIVRVDDFHQSSLLSSRAKEKYLTSGISSFLGAPVLKNGVLIAALILADTETQNWSYIAVELTAESAERTWAAVTRARAETALAKSEEKYRTLFNSIDEGVITFEVIFDEQERAVDCIYLENNPAFSRLTGLPPDVIGKRVSEVVPNLEQSWFDAFESVLKTGEPERFELTAAGIGNRWLDIYISRVGGTGSRTLIAVYNNITTRKRHEANLAFLAEVSKDLVKWTTIGKTMNRLGAKIGAYFGLGHCLFLEIDEMEKNVRIRYCWNRPDLPEIAGSLRVADFVELGFAEQSRAGKTIVARDLTDETVSDAERFVSLGIRSLVAVPLVRDGKWRFTLGAYASEKRDWTEDEIELLREITARIWTRLERARAEEALRESEERLRLAVEAGELGTWDWNLTTDEVFWNERHFILLGMPPRPNPLRAEEFFKHIHPEDAERVRGQLEQAVKDKTIFQTEFRAVTDAGETRWMDGYGQTVETDASGKTVRMSGVMFDVTELKRAKDIQREKETLQKMVGAQEDERRRIAQDLHDHLGQQLTALRLKIESIKIMCDGDEALRERVDETQAIAAQIDADIDFLAWQMRPTALDDIGLAAALANYVREWSAQFQIPADFQAGRFGKNRLAADAETHLYRIAQEALNNVYKHARARGVDVALERRDGFAVLIIEDDGIGFAPDEVSGKKNQKRIGLAGMKERAALVGGKVEIESAPGKGATVFVRVPVSKTD